MSKQTADNISIDQFISSAIGEKIAALETEQYLQKRAAKGSKEAFFSVLNKAPDVAPEKFDE